MINEVITHWLCGCFHDCVTAYDSLFTNPKGTREARTKINAADEHHESTHYLKTYAKRLPSRKYLISLNSAAASVRSILARTMPSLFAQLFGNDSILTTSITITATTSHDENYKRVKCLVGWNRWEKQGFQLTGISQLNQKERTCEYVFSKLRELYLLENLKWYLQRVPDMPFSRSSALQ